MEDGHRQNLGHRRLGDHHLEEVHQDHGTRHYGS